MYRIFLKNTLESNPSVVTESFLGKFPRKVSGKFPES